MRKSGLLAVLLSVSVFVAGCTPQESGPERGGETPAASEEAERQIEPSTEEGAQAVESDEAVVEGPEKLTAEGGEVAAEGPEETSPESGETAQAATEGAETEKASEGDDEAEKAAPESGEAAVQDTEKAAAETREEGGEGAKQKNE